MTTNRLKILMVLFGINGCIYGQSSNENHPLISMDTLRIKVDHTYAGEYPRGGSVFEFFEGSLFLYSYHPKEFQIDRIDISRKSQLPTVKLSREGPNKVMLFTHFTVSGNRLYFYCQIFPEISCTDMKGIVLKRHHPALPDSLKSTLSFIPSQMDIGSRGTWVGFHSNINIIKNTIFLPVYPMVSMFSKDYVKLPFYIAYDLEKSTTEISNFRYPEKIRSGSRYGDLIQSSISEINGTKIVSYAFSSALYCSDGSTLPEWLKNKENREVFANEVSVADYVNSYKNLQHLDAMHFGKIQKDVNSTLCIKPLFTAKFGHEKEVFPKESFTTIYVYDSKDWDLVGKIMVPDRNSQYLFDKKIYIPGSLISNEKGDFYEIFVIDLTKSKL